MADKKDPAVLFYTADFLADTTLWTYEELGRYIKLLCIQHLQGGVSEDDFIAVVGTCKRVSDKFTKGEDGMYRNKRMAEEADKRRKFSESRRSNISKRYEHAENSTSVAHMKNTSSTYEVHMENENINENINSNDNVVTKAVRHKYGEYLNVLLTDEELAKVKAEFPVDWAERIERLSEYIATTGKKYKSHLAVIRSWARRDAEEAPQTPPTPKAPAKVAEPIARYNSMSAQEALELALKRSYGDG